MKREISRLTLAAVAAGMVLTMTSGAEAAQADVTNSAVMTQADDSATAKTADMADKTALTSNVEAQETAKTAGTVMKTAENAKTGTAEAKADGLSADAPAVDGQTAVMSTGTSEETAVQRQNTEVQIEYMDARFFKKRNINQYNVHVYRQYKQAGPVSLHYGLTLSRATGYSTEDDIYRDSEAVGFGPSYMLRWKRHVSGKLDAAFDASGSALIYNHAHPGHGRAYGFLWRIGPRLIYNYRANDSLSLAYLFQHSSNGMGTHNPGYNGVGFSLGYMHWF